MAETTNKIPTTSESGSPSNMGFDSAAAAATIETMVAAQNNNPNGKSWFDTMTAKVAGVIFAIAATVITFRDAVSRAFFKTVNKDPVNGAFADLQIERENKIAAALAKRGTDANIPKEIAKAGKEYDKALRIRRNELGFTGVFKEASVLKKHQWLEVGFATAAVASVAVGAIMAIASSRSTAKKHAEELKQQSINPTQSR